MIEQGTPEWDAAVDAVMEKLHAPEDHAERVVRIVAEAIVAQRELPDPEALDG
jgi:hypothetical protein